MRVNKIKNELQFVKIIIHISECLVYTVLAKDLQLAERQDLIPKRSHSLSRNCILHRSTAMDHGDFVSDTPGIVHMWQIRSGDFHIHFQLYLCKHTRTI